MGIKRDEIVYISLETLKNYSGETLILPINNFINSSKFLLWFSFPDSIIPVYLGISIAGRKNRLVPKQIDYLKAHSPIGCRDIATYIFLNEQDIPAYFFGCISMTLPQRKTNAGTSVFLVDVPSTLLPYIPQELLTDANFIHHEVFIRREKDAFVYNY